MLVPIVVLGDERLMGGFGRQSNYQDRIDIPGALAFLHGLGVGCGGVCCIYAFYAERGGMELGERDGV